MVKETRNVYDVNVAFNRMIQIVKVHINEASSDYEAKLERLANYSDKVKKMLRNSSESKMKMPKTHERERTKQQKKKFLVEDDEQTSGDSNDVPTKKGKLSHEEDECQEILGGRPRRQASCVAKSKIQLCVKMANDLRRQKKADQSDADSNVSSIQDSSSDQDSDWNNQNVEKRRGRPRVVAKMIDSGSENEKIVPDKKVEKQIIKDFSFLPSFYQHNVFSPFKSTSVKTKEEAFEAALGSGGPGTPTITTTNSSAKPKSYALPEVRVLQRLTSQKITEAAGNAVKPKHVNRNAATLMSKFSFATASGSSGSSSSSLNRCVTMTQGKSSSNIVTGIGTFTGTKHVGAMPTKATEEDGLKRKELELKRLKEKEEEAARKREKYLKAKAELQKQEHEARAKRALAQRTPITKQHTEEQKQKLENKEEKSVHLKQKIQAENQEKAECVRIVLLKRQQEAEQRRKAEELQKQQEWEEEQLRLSV